MMKKLIFLVFLLMLTPMVAMTTSATTIDIDFLHGSADVCPINNATISNHTTTGDFTDITVNISQVSYGTLVVVSSNDILPISYSFVNNTKYYNYILTNGTTTEQLNISVDYSSIKVPQSPEEMMINNLTIEIKNLKDVIDELNNTIITLEQITNESNLTVISLKSELENKTSDLADLQLQYSELIVTHSVLENDYDILDQENDVLKSNVSSLEQSNSALAVLVSSQSDDIDALNDKIDDYKSFEDQVLSPFVMGYDNVDTGDGHIFFNVPSFVIGGGIFSALVVIMMNFNSFSSGKTIRSVGKTIHFPFLSKGDKLTPQEWDMIDDNDPMPNVEKEFLEYKGPAKDSDKNISDATDTNNIEKKDNNVSSETNHEESSTDKNSEESDKKKSEIADNTKVVKKKQKLNPSQKEYWKTPKGMAHRKRLSEMAKE